MTFLASSASRHDDQQNSTSGNPDGTTGGPIAALVIALPISLLLWGAVIAVLINVVR